MEAWKTGRLEEWKLGMVEYLEDLEEWDCGEMVFYLLCSHPHFFVDFS